MKICKKILIFSILILLYSCERSQLNEISFEQNVINDIFLELIVETFYYHQFLPRPPFPPLNTKDSLENIEKQKLREIKYQEVKSDSFKIILAINDTLFSTDKAFDDDWLKYHLSSDSIIKDFNYAYTSLANGTKKNNYLDISKISNTGRFVLKYYSNFTAVDFWNANPDIYGYIAFSRIYFNELKNKGVFYFGHTCGTACGAGYIVRIIKKNDKWEIENMIPLWVS